MTAGHSIDLHVHVREDSADARSSAAEMVAAAMRAGVAGFCVTPAVVPDELRQQGDTAGLSRENLVAHLRRGYDAARGAAAAMPSGPQIYFGIEYRVPKTPDDVLILGLEPEAFNGIDLLRADPWEVRRYAVERGGLLCSAHPFRHRSHGAPFGGPNLVEAVEVVNGRHRFPNRNELAARWCQRIGRIPLAGSDAHSDRELGEAVTEVSMLPETGLQLAGALKRNAAPDLRLRHFLQLGLQTCRFNGLFIEDELRHTSRQRLTAFEIFFDGFLPGEIDPKARARIASMAQGMGLRLSLLAPYNVPLAGSAGAALAQALCQFAVDVGAPLVVIPASAAAEATVLADAAAQLKERHIQLAVGNGQDLERRWSPGHLVELAARVPDLQLALDVGYAHLHSNAAQYTRELLALLHGSDKRVVHLQLHDNDGKADGHLSLGDGTLPLGEVLTALFAADFDGIGIIEHWREVGREVEQLWDLVYRIERPMAAVDLNKLAAAAQGS